MSEFDLGPAILFCPADRPERYSKAADRADAVILDLEDAVLPGDRDAARIALGAMPLDASRTIVRVNAPGSADYEADLRALAGTDYRYVMVAKAEHPDDLAALADYRIIVLCETARGIVNANLLAAHPAVVGLMWGAEDLVASLGGRSSRVVDGRYRDVAAHARSTVLLAAGAHGRAAIDAVYLDIPDIDGLRAEAMDAAASGFTATACIHPSQAEVIRAAYAPTETEREYATAVLAAAESERGVFVFRGRMVDEPVLAHARRILTRT